MIHEAILEQLRRGESLQASQMAAVMTHLAERRLPEDEIVEFLSALKKKGETSLEILEAARVLKERCVKITVNAPDLLDTCGTGGDGLRTVNASTLTALIAAAAGVPVAKHGNRSVSGIFGSADLLEGLGVRVQLGPEEVAACIQATGFGFIYAPLFHPAMRHAAAARKRIEGRTLSTCLGPLVNPASATHQLIGVYARSLIGPVAEACGLLGSKHVIAVHGEGGLDEVSLSGPTYVAEWQENQMRTKTVRPEDVGLTRVPLKELTCETAEEALACAQKVLTGRPGPATDFVLLNAGFALKAADRCPTVDQGILLGRKLLVQGAVAKKLEEVKAFTDKLQNEHAG